MKKLFVLAIIALFAMAPMAFAAGVALTDSEMDQISAGDWIVLTDADGNETVEDVYQSNNTLDLLSESQMELQAVNNSNAVDSAVAVQTNIASVTGDPVNNVGVNGRNEADIINYNPSDASAESSETAKSKIATSLETSSLVKDNYSSSSSSSSSSFKSDETLDVLGTLTASAASSSASSEKCKNCRSESASASAAALAALLTIDYDKHIVKGESSGSESVSICKVTEMSSKAESKTETSTEKSSKESRKNLGENNHLNLEDTSQQALQAVSNLNAVGSGVAMQTNIASNVGVSGTITHVNIASVVNGL